MENVEQNRLVSTFLATDMLRDQLVQLNLLNIEYVPKSLVDFYTERFISIKNLASDRIIRNFHFDTISYIDNKLHMEENYYYTSEYIADGESFLEQLQQMSPQQILDIFIELCHAIHYLHLKGFVYGALNFNAIYLRQSSEGFQLKLKDLATVELEKYNHSSDNMEDTYFKSPTVIAGNEPDSQSDMYSLGVMLLAMLRKKSYIMNPLTELSELKKEMNDDSNGAQVVRKLIPVLEKVLTTGEPNPYGTVVDLVTALSDQLEREISIVEEKEIDKLYFHTKLIGRELETSYILKNVENMMSYQPSKRIFFVQGENGIGKTRFLEEIQFLLELQKVNVYASFSLQNAGSSKKMWVDILRKLIAETDRKTVEKYQTELMKYFPELEHQEELASIDYLEEGDTNYRLLNRIAGFINESVKDKPAVMLIDDIHLADEFTIDTLNYLVSEVMERHNLMFILAGEEREDSSNKPYLDYIQNQKKRDYADTIRLKQLDIEQSGEMIKHILSISYVPMRLTERIYSRSYGNPLFISEVMKDLYSRHILMVDPDNGMWSVRLSSEDYNLLEIPDSIEQALLNQIHDLEACTQAVLETVAIFNKPIIEEMITAFLELPEADVAESVNDLVGKGILQRLVSDTAYLYEFANKVLKQMVYDAISPEEKISKHRQAASILESMEESSLDELILHYERSHNWEKSKQSYLENAKQMHVKRNKKDEIYNLEKALAFMEADIEKANLLISIGDLYAEINETERALTVLAEAERLALDLNHAETILDVYLYIANVYINQYQLEKTKEYMEKAEHAFRFYEGKAYRLEYKRLQAFILNVENRIEESVNILLEIIAENGDDFPKIIGNAYLLLGYAKVQHNQATEALSYYTKALRLLESSGYTKGYLGAINNIGIIYQGYLGERDLAMKYFIRARDLSEAYGIVLTEIHAISNIAGIYQNSFDLQTAFEHYNYALIKAERANMTRTVVHLYNSLAFVSLEMNDYEHAFHYYQLIDEKMKCAPDEGLDVFDYYNTSMELYQKIGLAQEANHFSDNIIDFHKGRENIYSYGASIYQLINSITTADSAEISNIVDDMLELVAKIPRNEFNVKVMSMAAVALKERDEGELGKKLVEHMEAFLTNGIPSHVLASYFYAVGIFEAGHTILSSLTKSLDLAKRAKSPELTAKAMLRIGDYFFGQGQYYNAANYYLEGNEIARSLINQVPVEFQLQYVNHHNLARGFIRLKEINDQLTGEQITLEYADATEEVLSQDMLKELLLSNEIEFLMQNQQFMQFIRQQHMDKLSASVRQTKDVLKNLSADTAKNLEMIIRYLAGTTLATRAVIITENQRQELSVLASTDGSLALPDNVFPFSRVRATMEPVILSGWQRKVNLDSTILSSDLSGAMYMPIIQQVSPDDQQNLMGFLYLETDKLVNNFHDNGLAACLEMTGFLALLLEKHQLKLSASLDKLTGALTRKYLDDALHDAVELSRKNGEQFSIIMFDLDRFKQVNDRYGHQIGDSVLRKVIALVMDNLDSSNAFGRYGGEEFIIILPSIDTDNAYAIAENLRKKIEEQKLLGDKFAVTVSLGIATYPEDGQTIKELVEKADQALYVAKESGRNNCQIWNQSFLIKSKPVNKLTGILTGDEIRDQRNVLAMVELIQLTNKRMPLREKLYYFLGRMIEITEAQIGYVMLLEDGNITQTYGRKSQVSDWIDHVVVNQSIIDSVLAEERGEYMINWDDIERTNKVNGLPDWDSVLAVPIKVEGIIHGLIYLKVPARTKEFGIEDLNLVNVFSNLAANVIDEVLVDS